MLIKKAVRINFLQPFLCFVAMFLTERTTHDIYFFSVFTHFVQFFLSAFLHSFLDLSHAFLHVFPAFSLQHASFAAFSLQHLALASALTLQHLPSFLHSFFVLSHCAFASHFFCVVVCAFTVLRLRAAIITTDKISFFILLFLSFKVINKPIVCIGYTINQRE